MAAGVRFGCVLADAGYGLSAPFRQGLTARGLTWAVGIPGRQKVYPAEVRLIFPVAGRGRPRQRHIPDLSRCRRKRCWRPPRWRTVSWRHGTKGPLKARFAAVRVRVADGPPQRIRDMGAPASAWRGGLADRRAPHVRESASTISRTCPHETTCAHSPPPSRRAGFASRPISNSKRNSVSITSRDDPGKVFIVTLS